MKLVGPRLIHFDHGSAPVDIPCWRITFLVFDLDFVRSLKNAHFANGRYLLWRNNTTRSLQHLVTVSFIVS